MKTIIAILMFLLPWVIPVAEASETVRVSLFSIFKPRTVNLSGNAKVTVVTEDGRRKKLSVRKLKIRCGGKSPVVLQTGSTRIGAGAIEVIASQGLLTVYVPRGPKRKYEGLIEIREREGKCLIINQLPLDSYARDVACRELSGAGPEAMRAQAVLTRSYALKPEGRHQRQEFDLCDLTHCQVFTGPGACTKKQRETIGEVSGLALLYKGSLANAYYFSTCGGHTGAAAEVWGPATARPYLGGVKDGNPPFCARSDHMRWGFAVERSELCPKLKKALPRLGPGACQLEVVSTGRGGWVGKVAIRARRPVEMSGDNFHLLMGRIFGWSSFKSARFTLEAGPERFTFRGRGMGHGVGMCQHGAMGMEKAGKNYRAILKHYFPGTEVGPWP